VVKEKITLAIDKQLHQIRKQIETEQVRVPIHHDKDFFSNVIRKIARFALLKSKKNLREVLNQFWKNVLVTIEMSLVCHVLISCNKCNILFLWMIFINSGSWTGL